MSLGKNWFLRYGSQCSQPIRLKDFQMNYIPRTNFFKKSFMVPFNGWGSAASRLRSHYKETVYFLPLSSQEVLVLIGSTSDR